MDKKDSNKNEIDRKELEKNDTTGQDQVDSLQLGEIISDKLCRNLNNLNNAKLNEDQRIELRNLNQFISIYGKCFLRRKAVQGRCTSCYDSVGLLLTHLLIEKQN